MKEQWKYIPGYEGYQASNLGEIRSIDRNIAYPNGGVRFLHGCLRKPHISHNGYYRLKLCISGDSGMHVVHRLVAQTFIPNPLNKPQINHKDGNKLNNCVDNLEWCTAKENNTHAIDTGLKNIVGSRHPQSIINEETAKIIKKLIAAEESLISISKNLSVSYNIVKDISRKKTWRHV